MVNCPYCLKEIKLEASIPKTKRKELILACLTEEITLEKLYIRVRRKGYPMLKRTFHRDIFEMNASKLLRAKPIIGGKHGTTTYISRGK